MNASVSEHAGATRSESGAAFTGTGTASVGTAFADTSFDNSTSGLASPSTTREYPLHDMGSGAEGLTDADIDKEVPDSGWKAWLVVFGAFCANIMTSGFLNSTGTVQEYISTHFLSQEPESSVGWIFSLYMFLMFFCGIQTGPLVDTIGIKPILVPGCILWCAALFIMSTCSEYYEFILGFSVLGGISSSLIYNPSFTVISQWFTTKRAVALGFVSVGSSAAGCFLPIVLSTLFEGVGYGWTMRIIAFMFVGLSVVACATMQSRNRSPANVRWKDISIDLRSLKTPSFSFCVLGMVLLEWAYFLPSMYIVGFARTLGYTAKNANLLLVYLNIGSTFGRIGSGYAGRFYGSFNTMMLATMLAGLACLCIWVPVGHTRGGLTAFAVVFGTFSGAGMSMGPTCVAYISNSQNFGRRYGTMYAFVSFAVLTSLPIGGALAHGKYTAMKFLAGSVCVVSSGAWLVARYFSYGNKRFA